MWYVFTPNNAEIRKLVLRLADKVCEISMTDFQLALCHIVPSMYRDLEGMIELHAVDWDDIGGLKDVKQALQQVGNLSVSVLGG